VCTHAHTGEKKEEEENGKEKETNEQPHTRSHIYDPTDRIIISSVWCVHKWFSAKVVCVHALGVAYKVKYVSANTQLYPKHRLFKNLPNQS